LTTAGAFTFRYDRTKTTSSKDTNFRRRVEPSFDDGEAEDVDDMEDVDTVEELEKYWVETSLDDDDEEEEEVDDSSSS